MAKTKTYFLVDEFDDNIWRYQTLESAKAEAGEGDTLYEAKVVGTFVRGECPLRLIK